MNCQLPQALAAQVLLFALATQGLSGQAEVGANIVNILIGIPTAILAWRELIRWIRRYWRKSN